MATTGTATLTTIGLNIGDVATNQVGGGYLTGFNVTDIAVSNFGLAIGVLEQNAHHDHIIVDRFDVGLFDQMQFDAENDELIFTNFQNGATKAAQYNIDWSAYSVGVIFIAPVLEPPNHDDPTAANMIIADGIRAQVLQGYNTPADGLSGGQKFTGEGIDILGTYSAEGSSIKGGFSDSTVNANADIHVYSGSHFHLEDYRIYDTLRIDKAAILSVLDNDELNTVVNNSTSTLRFGGDGFSGDPVMFNAGLQVPATSATTGASFGGAVLGFAGQGEVVDMLQNLNGRDTLDFFRADDVSQSGYYIKALDSAATRVIFGAKVNGDLLLGGPVSGLTVIHPTTGGVSPEFMLPQSSGTLGQVMTSSGSGTSPMTWSNPGGGSLQQPSAAPTPGQYLSTNSSSNPPTLIWSSGGAGALGCGSVAPTVASCGTSPVQPANSTNCAGSFTTGTGAPGGCTMTFATAAISSLAGVPICMFWDNNAIGGSVIIYDAPTNAPTATDVLTFSAAATSHQIKYQCGWIN